MNGIRSNKAAQVRSFYRERLNDIATLAKSDSVSQALSQFDGAFQVEGETSGLAWNTIEDRFGEELDQYPNEQGYADLLLVSANGDVVYTSSRGEDLGKNVREEGLRGTALSAVFEAIMQQDKNVHLEDYEFYPPASEVTAFLAAPVHRFGDVIGMIVLRLSEAAILSIAYNREGLGASGQIYFINSKGEVVGNTGNTTNREQLLPDVESRYGSTSIVEGPDGGLYLVSFEQIHVLDLNWDVAVQVELEGVINPSTQSGQDDFLTNFIRSTDYYNLFLIHPSGKVFYAAKHEANYGTNVLTEYDASKSGLGHVVRRSLESGGTEMSDLVPYAPSNSTPSSFIAQPLLADDEPILVVALQFTDDFLNRIMSQREGMGNTGESYLVGSDYRMRSDSLMDPENFSVRASFANKNQGIVKTDSTEAALSGESGTGQIQNYSGIEVLSSYVPLFMENQAWALITEVDVDEAFESVGKLRHLLLLVSGILCVLIVLLSLKVTHLLIAPLHSIIVNLADSSRKIAGIVEHQKLVSSSQASAVSEIATSLDEIGASSQQSAEQATSTSQDVNIVADLAKQGQVVVDNSLNGMEEIKAKIESISEQINLLSQRISEVGEITELVRDLGKETSLLALNAKVEAVHAGSHGKGFDLVASEIRKISNESKDSTRHISELLESVQNATHSTATVTDEGGAAIVQGIEMASQALNKFIEVTDAYESTTLKVQMILQNVTETAIAIGQVVNIMQSIKTGAQENLKGAEQMETSIEQLDRAAQSLKAMM